MQNDVEQRTVDLQRALRTAGIINEAQFPESIHEEADSRTSCPDHLSQRFLAHLRDHGFRNAVLAKMSKQEKNARQSLFARESLNKASLSTGI